MDPLIEEIFSEDRKRKIEIRRRTDGNLQLFAFYWCEENEPEYEHLASCWAQMGTGATVVDSLERARARADELLSPTSKPNVR
jgi:hypothetical protein